MLCICNIKQRKKEDIYVNSENFGKTRAFWNFQATLEIKFISLSYIIKWICISVYFLWFEECKNRKCLCTIQQNLDKPDPSEKTKALYVVMTALTKSNQCAD